jgi:hypothetical protein
LSDFYIVEPEVAGGWGSNTKAIRTLGEPVIVTKLHYVFDDWLGDALLTTSPCYIGTELLAGEIEKTQLDGVLFDEVEITKSDQFKELYPNLNLPKFLWFKIHGSLGKDDFGMTSNLQLVVSKAALEILKNIGLSNAVIEEFKP